MSNGKGSKPRPYSISQEEYADRWQAAFGKKKKNYVIANPSFKSKINIIQKDKNESSNSN
jgi:hypothetical protein